MEKHEDDSQDNAVCLKQLAKDGIVIIATGPLTSDQLSQEIIELTGNEGLHFYDAAAPIIEKDSINMNIAFWGDRYEQERGKDEDIEEWKKRIQKNQENNYINLPMNREEYEKFWANFGLQLKYGVYNDFGAHKDMLVDLLLFTSSKEKKLVTLKEYVERMKEGQEVIYFASGDDVNKIDQLPAAELVKDKGYEILYLTDNVDEFALQVLQEYDSKKFKNITQGDLNLESEEEKKQVEEKKEENKDLLEALKESLKDKVSDVKLSTRLKSHPVCLSADEGLSFEMEKVLAQMPDGNPYGMKAVRILEINPNHAIFNALQNVYAKDKDKISKYADLLYDQALLIEGFNLEDPIAFSNAVCELMVEASK